MLPEKIMQSDLLDIVFENRNKMYGAYALRREYNKRLYKSVTVTMAVALLFILSAQVKYAHTKIPLPPVPDMKDLIAITLQPDKPVLPKATAPAAPKPPATVDYHNLIIVPDSTNVKPLPAVNDLDGKRIGDTDTPGEPANGDGSGTGNGNGALIQPAGAPVKPVTPIAVIFEHTEIMPEYPGGNEAFQKFMRKNLAQPDDIPTGEKITVMVKFIVNEEGTITGATILNSGRKDLDKEVLRVINKMPNWIPGTQNHQPVSVYFNLPVTFIGQEL